MLDSIHKQSKLIDSSSHTGPQVWIYKGGGEEIGVGIAPVAGCNHAYLEKALMLDAAGIIRLP